jgi:hypothetical protein
MKVLHFMELKQDLIDFFYVFRTVPVMPLKLYIITPTRAQVTNKRILVKDIRYNPTCFGALRHHHQRKNIRTLSAKDLIDFFRKGCCFKGKDVEVGAAAL